jgi:23S rRNA (uracil1939-C5)-methyltransferase
MPTAALVRLTLPIAQRAEYCLGLEVQEEAVEIARRKMPSVNQIRKCQVQGGHGRKTIAHGNGFCGTRRPDIVVLDPPVRDAAIGVLDALLTLHPQRIVYMSCNPATLARDLKQLCEGGYRLQRVQPADFFPQTAM